MNLCPAAERLKNRRPRKHFSGGVLGGRTKEQAPQRPVPQKRNANAPRPTRKSGAGQGAAGLLDQVPEIWFKLAIQVPDQRAV